MTIDWTKPIEAYHTDGRVVPMTYNFSDREGNRLTTNSPNDSSNCYWNEDGTDCVLSSGWRIRNRQPTTVEVDAAIWERMQALVKKMAKYGANMKASQQLYFTASDFDEAREIAKLLPVDVDEDEANKLLANSFLETGRVPTLRKYLLQAIKRGRELERGDA